MATCVPGMAAAAAASVAARATLLRGCPLAPAPPLAGSPSHSLPRPALQVRAKLPEPGMYGGPPDRKFRRSWGGEPKKDPLETGDYLWDNAADWKRVLDQEMAEASAPPSSASAAGASQRDSSQGSGFLSLGRSLALDSMDVDLSRELMPARTATLQDQVEQARILAGERRAVKPEPSTDDGSIKWRSVNTPSNRETMRREKSMSFSFKPGSYGKEGTPLTAEQQEEQFQELKNRLILYTLGLGVAFTVSAAAVYSPEVGVSFGVGAFGSLIYVRMLSTSVESIGSSSLGAAAKGGLGSQRLLVPVVLVMTYNRWNAILVPEYGFLGLQLIPMLLGFLTYKAATIVQTFQDLLVEETKEEGRKEEGR